MSNLKPAFDFLQQLEKNNNRVWFSEHKNEFDAIVKDNKSFFEDIFATLSTHDFLGNMQIFRIYKDVRFSKDKTPYKTNFGVGFGRNKPKYRGGYYLHLQPGNSFVGGGFWAPEKDDLYRIRKEFEKDNQTINTIVSEPIFQKYFGELQGEQGVKTAPKGFDKNNPAIELIKKKQFVVIRKFTDKEILSSDFDKRIIETFLAMRPFLDYMTEILTTDLNGESLI
ncbi:MAG: DUF2461 domain-containing protein [Bacteroidetes bacterium]|jgi:uncharacterized protein (TIGR02453 family)|nr:DUF2461 domain-containing protein [Bacteroidota bacterium]